MEVVFCGGGITMVSWKCTRTGEKLVGACCVISDVVRGWENADRKCG